MSLAHVVVVSYRTAGLAAECLRSLAPEVAALPGCRVTVVEGGSGDGSAERLAASIRAGGWGDWCELLALAENRGFAAGNNAAIRPLLAGPDPPDSVLLLNPDTVARPGALRALVEFLEANPAVGIAGSRPYLPSLENEITSHAVGQSCEPVSSDPSRSSDARP